MLTLVKFIVILALSTSFLGAQNTDSHHIKVSVSGLNSSKGKLLVGLYSQEDSFLVKQYKSMIASIENESSTLIFKNIPDGTYAVSFVHDANDNGKMDTNFMGIPKEDYGCSNNARGFMGPPKWNDAKFELKGADKTITISL